MSIKELVIVVLGASGFAGLGIGSFLRRAYQERKAQDDPSTQRQSSGILIMIIGAADLILGIGLYWYWFLLPRN